MNILVEPIYIGLIQTLISFTIISGLIFCGNIISTNFFKNYNNLLLNLLLSVVIFSQLLKIISFLGFFKEANLIFSFFLFFAGIYNLKFFYVLFDKNKLLIPRNIFEISIALTLLAFFIISIAPPSMADALDYHYGVPLYLLNFNEFPNTYSWVHSNLAGNGEFINSLTIFLGTDNFASLLQIFALSCFLLFLREKIQNKKKLLFLCIFVLGSPTLLQLISGPKFLLFPQILTASALLLILEKKKIESSDYIFIAILLMGAAQFKLSFLLSGLIVGIFLFLKSFINNKINVLIFSIILLVIFFGPTFLWNYNQLDNFNYRNIITALPKEYLSVLSGYRENFNYIYPLNLFLPNSIGSISTILGFQFFILFFIYRKNKDLNLLIVITFLTISLQYFLGMNEARIYYEFILWLAVGIYFLNDENINFTFFSKILLVQLLGVCCMAFYFALISLPSLFSNEHRDKFMEKNSFEYSAVKWVNDVLPDDAKIISELRSVSFYKMEFMSMDRLGFYHTKDQLTKYLNYIKERKFNYIVLKENSSHLLLLKNCLGNMFMKSPDFKRSTRNPINRSGGSAVIIYEFNYKDLIDCVKSKN